MVIYGWMYLFYPLSGWKSSMNDKFCIKVFCCWCTDNVEIGFSLINRIFFKYILHLLSISLICRWEWC